MTVGERPNPAAGGGVHRLSLSYPEMLSSGLRKRPRKRQRTSQGWEFPRPRRIPECLSQRGRPLGQAREGMQRWWQVTCPGE